jgi:hypothetical protein
MKTKNSNLLYQQLGWVTQNIIDAICSIKTMPEGLLPHSVFIEEENGKGEPAYTKYQIVDIDPIEKNCIIYNKETDFQEEISLESVHVDWLATIWNRYLELSGETENTGRSGIEKALRLLLNVALLEIPRFEESQTFITCEQALNNNLFYGGNNKVLNVFLYPAGRFVRNATDEEITADYDANEGQDPCTEKYTPDEFAAMMNDGDYPHRNMYVRFIEY